MEMLLYLFGNWCCISAACIILYHWHTQEKDYLGRRIGSELLISKDLQIMLFLGACVRVYWSCSPPPVWADEPMLIQLLSMLDVFSSPLFWLAVCMTGSTNKAKPAKRSVPEYLRWPVLTAGACLLGLIATRFLPPLDQADSWPYADVVVVCNMILEGFAMIPQMHLVAYSEDKASPEASHFVGLLCLGRVFRIAFWATLLISQLLRGDEHGMYIWTFIIPDVLHTLIMGDYLYLWMGKVKQDSIDPFVASHLNV